MLVDAHTRADGGWQLRANNLAADWKRRCEVFAATDVVQGELIMLPASAGFAAFPATLAALLQAMAPPLTGVVLVLAPGVVEAPEVLADELTGLLVDPALERVRLVWLVDTDAPLPQMLLDSLGPERALVTDCAVDQAAQTRDLAALLGGGDPNRFGTAWPALHRGWTILRPCLRPCAIKYCARPA